MSAGKESGAPASQQQPWAPDAVALGREVGVGAPLPPSVCPAAGHPGSRWGRRPTGAGPWPASRAPAPVVRPHGPLVLPWRLPPGWTQCWGTAPASDLQPSQPLHREVVCRVPVEGCPLSPKQGLDCSPRGREALGLTPSQGSPREEPCLRAPPGVGGCLLRQGGRPCGCRGHRSHPAPWPGSSQGSKLKRGLCTAHCPHRCDNQAAFLLSKGRERDVGVASLTGRSLMWPWTSASYPW